ncbi:hypothetical protein BRO54_0959 [Geobacillus proteiniphilus]|uniref:Uncharacterized protein n=1 Tax=Geobacillus proteiniphilus TaxID=860353 RepID=A0A1Q5T520_9BACL|nr:hypothetical protein BRO54_0959 [Geobacillus proteiniphilus]
MIHPSFLMFHSKVYGTFGGSSRKKRTFLPNITKNVRYNRELYKAKKIGMVVENE